MTDQLEKSWLTIGQAVELSSQLEGKVSGRTIRWAALHEFISGATKTGQDWLLPRQSFLYWLNHRPKPGRKTKEVDHAPVRSR